MKFLKLPLMYVPNKSELPQILAIIISSLSGITQATLYSWPSPSILEIVSRNDTDISFEEVSYFTVISPITSLIVIPLYSSLSDLIGRKASGLLIAVPQLMAWIMIYLAKNVWYYYFSRVAAGIGDAAFYSTVPVYVCEVAQPKVRGTWGNMMTINISFGIFLINVVGAYYNVQTTAAICGCLPIAQFILCCFLPESPYYLLMKGREDLARKSLRKLRWSKNVDDELAILKVDIQRQCSESGSLRDLFMIPTNLKALIICIIARLAQQFSGLAAFETYTQYLFHESGSNLSEKTSSIIFSAVLLVCVAGSAYFVEKVGRRPLMIFSCFASTIVLSILSIYFGIAQYTRIPLSNFNWIPLTGMIVYLVVSSCGIGILPTLFLGELFSTNIKGKAISVNTITISICCIAIPKLFQSLTYNFGIFVPFAFFTACCVVSTCLSYLCCIETKGKTLEEVQQVIRQKSFSCC